MGVAFIPCVARLRPVRFRSSSTTDSPQWRAAPRRSHAALGRHVVTSATTSPPPSPAKPSVTPLALLLVLSTTAWSLLLLVPALLLSLLRRSAALASLTGLALRAALRTAGISVAVRHHGDLPTAPCLFVANHQSALDIFALTSLNRPLVSILPSRVASIPGFGWLVRLANWILARGTDRRAQMDALKQVGERLTYTSVAVFPEGIPSVSGHVAKFATPFFKVARQAGAAVVPVTVHGGVHVGAGVPQKWGKYRVDVHRPIDLSNISDKEAAQQARQTIINALPDTFRED